MLMLMLMLTYWQGHMLKSGLCGGHRVTTDEQVQEFISYSLRTELIRKGICLVGC